MFKNLLLLAAICAAAAFAETNTVMNMSNYGEDFSISPAKWPVLHPGDTVTFHSDDPGRLVLRLGDHGRALIAQPGQDVTFTAEELAGVENVRCSMVTEQGELVGWEATHEEKYGGTPDTIPNASVNRTTVPAWVAALLLALGVIH